MFSTVVIAKNEAANIGRCLQSLAGCGDVVLVDDNSADGTRTIARSLGARVVTHGFETFASQRNWALEHIELAYPWVLMLDANETTLRPPANSPPRISNREKLLRRRTGTPARRTIYE